MADTISSIDPMQIITNSTATNAIPDLSKMQLFVELTAQRREGSIIVANGNSNRVTSNGVSKTINMMGFDTTTGKYTTNWSRTYTDGTQKKEGFGITSVNIKVNSSYVPVIDIEFVDIRGGTLFAYGAKSDYAVLFSFPPAIFTLTVKGYFGLALTYNLHLVKQNSRFDAQSGNFIISANFVGQKYAPLTDILFKYIDIVPLIDQPPTNSGISLDPAQPPTSTRELITKAQQLYDNIDTFKNESVLASEAEKIGAAFNQERAFLSVISNVQNLITDTQFQQRIGLYKKMSGTNNIETTNLNDYDALVRATSPSAQGIPSTKLLVAIGWPIPSNGKIDPSTQSILSQISSQLTIVSNSLQTQGANVLTTLKNTPIGKPVFEQGGASGQLFTSIDITNFYSVLSKDIQTKKSEYDLKQNAFKSNVDNITTRSLGKIPTIKFIFSILCNDVDKFMKKMIDVGTNGETHHTQNFNAIAGNNGTTRPKITAFPLVIKESATYNDRNLSSSSQSKPLIKQERAYPSEIFPNIPVFPEVNFVESFIDKYIKTVQNEQIINMRNSKDENGNSKWTPVNPLDTKINGITPAVPYVNKFILSPDLISEILNRFYVASQFSYDNFFYKKDENILSFFGIDKNYGRQGYLLDFIAKGEAANLINSMVDKQLLDNLMVQAKQWSATNIGNGQTGVDLFYNALNKSAIVYNEKGQGVNTYQSFGTTGTGFIDSNFDPYVLLNNTKIVKNRANPDYKGFDILLKKPDFRIEGNTGSGTGTETNPVDQFLEGYSTTGEFFKNLFFGSADSPFDKFTQENLMFVGDRAAGDDPLKSDFLYAASSFTNIPDVLAFSLAKHSALFTTILADTTITDTVKTYIFGTLFINSISYFDGGSKFNDINKKFAFPSVIEVPQFAHLFMGGIAYFNSSGTTTINQVEIDTYNAKYGTSSSYGSNGFTISPPRNNAGTNINLISVIDTTALINYFTTYAANTTSNPQDAGFGYLKNQMQTLIAEVKGLTTINQNNVDEVRTAFYNRLAGKDTDANGSNNDYSQILTGFLTKDIYLLNYTQITFYPFTNGYTVDPVGNFLPLSKINTIDPTFRQTNQIYFQKFFAEVVKLINSKNSELQKNDNKIQSILNNNDLKTQLYYSFKSISDRWVVGYGQNGIIGNNNSKAAVNPNGAIVNDTSNANALINDFIFIDRAGNDIGDKVVIDFRPLIEMSKDFDVSVFTVMARILSLNGFEFFPLQNFIDYANTAHTFTNTFKLSSSRSLEINTTPKFVCMYIGGTSSQLDDIGSPYDNDGVNDLSKLKDFKNSPAKAFNVVFGQQNNSLFTNIELNTNEHKETNESLAILSDLAQDHSTSSPVPQGQNMYSTYEQRSYTCKVDMLGDIMIQPTQYFMLQNVPMFAGAYLILNVEHNIVPNFMKTSFEGVRIRTIPQPFVKDFSTAIGIQGGNSDANYVGGANLTGDVYNSNSILAVNPITNDQTSKLISPK